MQGAGKISELVGFIVRLLLLHKKSTAIQHKIVRFFVEDFIL